MECLRRQTSCPLLSPSESCQQSPAHYTRSHRPAANYCLSIHRHMCNLEESPRSHCHALRNQGCCSWPHCTWNCFQPAWSNRHHRCNRHCCTDAVDHALHSHLCLLSTELELLLEHPLHAMQRPQHHQHLHSCSSARHIACLPHMCCPWEVRIPQSLRCNSSCCQHRFVHNTQHQCTLHWPPQLRGTQAQPVDPENRIAWEAALF
mmetsp:Transcript_43021/g.98902  ORF Transcript_43021/g.98902 Transcript_43021/m.98902 type:complete len:205 (-) Transcript_43021:23-637(-)